MKLEKYMPLLIEVKDLLMDEPNTAGRKAITILENLLRDFSPDYGIEYTGDLSGEELIEALADKGFIRDNFLKKSLLEICDIKSCLHTSKGFFLKPRTAMFIITTLEMIIKHNAKKATHLISNRPVIADVSDTLGYAKEIMMERGFSQLPVMDGIRIIGMLSLKGLIGRLNIEYEKRWEDVKIGEIKKYLEKPFIINKETPIKEILDFFKQNPTSMLIVTETGEETSKLIGVITASDIIPWL